MAKSRKRKQGRKPIRTRPVDAIPDIVERIVSRRQIHIEDGDVVITKERVPRVNPHATFAAWRYCLRISPFPEGRMFTSFQNAASAAEQYATVHDARVLYIENDAPTVLADYRHR